MKKVGVLVVVAAVVAAFLYFDLGAYLSLERIQQERAELQQLWNDDPWLLGGGFFIVYVLATAVSFPGATILTLAGGAIFGLLWGTIIISFASTIGATLAMLMSRVLLRDWVAEKFKSQIGKINHGVEKDGGFYLFGLRLVPAFPFFMVNLVMGLTNIRTRTYFFVSQLGMFPATVVYVNAGEQISSIDSLSGLLSAELLIAFSLLGLLPLVARFILNKLQAKRGASSIKLKSKLDWSHAQKTYKQYKKPKKFDTNLIVIGGGSAGLVSSYIAAAVKAKVTLIEAEAMGGDCLNYGCVPSKALIHAAKTIKEGKHANTFGMQLQGDVDFAAVMDSVQTAVTKIEPHDSVERYTDLGVDCIEGYAKLVSPWEVQVGDKTISAPNIILASGAKPFIPPLPGIEDMEPLHSNNLWQLREKPKSMLVLGGGPIGCELAQAFAGLDIDVTQIELFDQLMPREDNDVAEFARQQLEKTGVNVRLKTKALRFEEIDGQRVLWVENADGQEEKIEFDRVLVAVGRVANTKGFGLEELGVEVDRTIVSDAFQRTNFPNIFVCGDATGPYQFTHVAAHQAWYASVNALFGKFKKFATDYSVIPWVTFTDPEIARVGISEKEAEEQGLDFEATIYDISDLDRAITEEADYGFVKVITPKGKDAILGVVIAAPRAGEMLMPFVMAMKYGHGLNKILGMIHPYPSWGEANKYIAGEWRRNHQPEKILNLLKKYHAFRRGE